MAVAVEELAGKIRSGTDPEQTALLVQSLSPQEQRDLLREMLSELPADTLAEMQQLSERLSQEWAPETREQLWELFRTECGLEIPRRAVCEGHCAPFDFAADVYFQEGNTDKLAIGNRGSGKTQIMGAVHALNSRTKPHYSGATAGSVKTQAQRCWGYFNGIVKGWTGVVSKLQMSGSVFKNGSEVEIITGTLTGVNSPHPRLTHLDEIELFREGVFDEAMHMAQSDPKRGYRALNVSTTSWKKARGPVSTIMSEIDAAKRDGYEEPYQIYRWCVWETTQRCEADCAACPFANVRKGVWTNGQPRTFEQVCKRGSPVDGIGKLKFTEGFVAVEDAVSRFKKLPRRSWESQQESRRPTTDGLVYDIWDEDEFTVSGWIPDPALGEIDASVDFGGTDPHAVLFYQQLKHDVDHGERRLKQGTTIIFDEIYEANIGSVELGRRVNERINEYDMALPGFRSAITGFYRDPAAKAASLDWARLEEIARSNGMTSPEYLNIPTTWTGGVGVSESVAYIYEAHLGKGLIMVDRDRCPNTIEEFGSYEKSPTTGEPLDQDNHAMDSMRYRFWNRHVKQRRRRSGGGATSQTRTRAVTHTDGGRYAWNQSAISRTGVRNPDAVALDAPRRRRGLGF